MASIDVSVDLDVLLPALREAAGAELRGTGALTLRAQGFSVRRHEHRPLLVVTRDGARRLRVRCWPNLGGLGSWAGWLLVCGAATWFAGGAVLSVALLAGMLAVSISGVLGPPFAEHSRDDVEWLAAVLERATKRLPPPEVGDDYR